MKSAINGYFAASLLLAVLTSNAPAQAEKPASRPVESGRIIREAKLAGTYEDLPSMSVGLGSLLGGDLGAPKSFFQLIADLKAIAKEPGSEVLVDLSTLGFSVNDAQIAELERAIDQLRAAKVQTTAYLENATTKHYLVAALCDRIVTPEIAMLDLSAPAI